MHRNDSINRLQFASPAELVEFVKTGDTADYLTDNYLEDFFGKTTGTEAMRKAITGDDSFVPEAQKLIASMSLDVELSMTVDEPDVVGCYPVAAEFIAGIPECMRMPTKVGSDRAPLSIFLDMTTSHSIKPSEYKTRGLAVLALVIALSSVRPIQLEIGCVMGSDSNHKIGTGEKVSMISTIINTAPLDLATAAWAVTDVAFARRLIYGASYKAHGFTGSWPSLHGVGYAEPQSAKHIKRVTELLDLPGETLYLPAIADKDEDTQLALTNPSAWVQKWFNRYTEQVAELA